MLFCVERVERNTREKERGLVFKAFVYLVSFLLLLK